MVIKMQMPDPSPNSNSCDVNNCWKVQGNFAANPENGGNNTNMPTGGNAGGAVPQQQFTQNVNAIPQGNMNNLVRQNMNVPNGGMMGNSAAPVQ